jgi:hypothetical protein
VPQAEEKVTLPLVFFTETVKFLAVLPVTVAEPGRT